MYWPNVHVTVQSNNGSNMLDYLTLTELVWDLQIYITCGVWICALFQWYQSSWMVWISWISWFSTKVVLNYVLLAWQKAAKMLS